MINNIKEVLVAETNGHKVYIGTLRNQRRFSIGDNVFFAVENFRPLEIFRGQIVGIEITQSINSEYIYKIEVPKDIVYQGSSKIHRVSLNCETIFNNLDEAKQSVLDGINHYHKIKTDECNRYFAQFEK